MINPALQLQNKRRPSDVFSDLWRPEDRLRYYQQRSDVYLVPVLDEPMTGLKQMGNILENWFEFNAEGYHLAPPIRWLNNPSRDLEWHILLHKFYYAPGLGKAWQESGDARYLQQWVQLTDSWIAQTSVDYIAAEVTGRRVQNWIYAWYYFVDQSATEALDADFHDRFLNSIIDQVQYLCEHLAPSRNHRTIALTAIFLAAIVFPEMPEASAWLDFSIQEIHRNIQQDLLDDGVQCELSTDYHHLVLKNYLVIRRLARLNEIPMDASFDQRLNRALDFSLHAHKPDGEVPSFSDGDVRSFLMLLGWGAELYSRQDLLYAATRGQQGMAPKQRNGRFDSAGYFILRSGWGEGTAYSQERYLMFDCGPLGAGNHGHLDALHFEAAAFGRSLIVDPGRYTYHEKGGINWRVKFRGTAAHNTVLVDGKNQTRYCPASSRFKISGPAPDTRLHTFFTSSDLDYLHGSTRSDEYDALHYRQILFVKGEYWIVVDTLTSPSCHRYEQLFHLALQGQDTLDIDETNHRYQVTSRNLLLTTPQDPALLLFNETGFISKQYGEKQAAPVLKFTKYAENTRFITVLYPFRNEVPELVVKVTSDELNPLLTITTTFHATPGNPITDRCFVPIPQTIQPRDKTGANKTPWIVRTEAMNE